MIDFKRKIAYEIAGVITETTPDDVYKAIEIPADKNMGDFAFPCFRFAKIMKRSPADIAKKISFAISGADIFEKVEPVNAYVNIFINRKVFSGSVIDEINSAGKNYGSSDIGANRNVVVEFSAPNIAKPFHIGHIRSTVIGNSIYKLYDKLGFNVIRVNHLGDYGTQFGKMIVAYKKWGSPEELEHEPIKALLKYYMRFHEEVAHDPSLDDQARKTFARLEHGEKEETELWEKFRSLSLKEFNRVYKMLGIEFDSYAGESFYTDKMPAVLQELKDKRLLHESQGAEIVDLEEYGMAPALITKSDGTSLYITRDITAAIYRKKTYNFYKNIYVVASQQNLHFKQWKKVLELMGYEWEKDCIHVPFGLVSLEDGTMSTRHGRVVFLEDVLSKAVEKTEEIIREKNPDEDNVHDIAFAVGIGAVIFQELSNNRIKDYTFSWEKVLNFDGETGPYVQYTHARAASLIRNAGISHKEIISMRTMDGGYLTSDSAYELIKLLYRVPEIIKDAAHKYEPSILTRHLIDVAQSFNRFYHDEHILVDDEKEKLAKLSLVSATKIVISNCLELLGITAPERM